MPHMAQTRRGLNEMQMRRCSVPAWLSPYQSTTSLTYHQSLTKLITNHLDPLPIYPLHPLRDRRKYIPRNRSGLRRKLGGQDRLFSNVDRFKMRNVNHGLVHGNSAKEWTTFSADKHVGVPA